MVSKDKNNKLMQRVQIGDTSAFEKLVKENMNSSYFFVKRMLQNNALSEDIVQEGFIRVWEKRETWQEKSHFKTWFFKILYHLCIDHIRAQENTTKLNIAITNQENPSQNETIEKNQQLQAALATLKPEEKAILFWYYYHALSQKNIAEMMGISISAVESSLYRARQKLKAELL